MIEGGGVPGSGTPLPQARMSSNDKTHTKHIETD